LAKDRLSTSVCFARSLAWSRRFRNASFAVRIVHRPLRPDERLNAMLTRSGPRPVFSVSLCHSQNRRNLEGLRLGLRSTCWLPGHDGYLARKLGLLSSPLLRFAAHGRGGA